MRKNNKIKEEIKETLADDAVLLEDEALEAVTGAGNPFANLPRIPTQPIDDELREDA